ncbi:histidine--tRNA ligase [Candidatus Saccharibacteria bacterium]|jgi:histidyl-tRNA synthetase|nr:histidine--tRNA ligase [Candidatus Saccharibacteria bacterium]
MSKISTQPYKGTRDFYPEDFRLREYIFSKWREVCQSFGYEEYEASVIEPLELYTAKTSEEIVKEQTFSFTDRGGRDVTLRPEMTPTVSRMVAARRQELGYPLRLFSIPNCFRYERMQRGRTREFWQLNLDMFGVAGIEAEVEILLASHRLVEVFGATEDMFEIRINSRKLLNEIIEVSEPKGESQDVVRLIDVHDKLSQDEFANRLSSLVGKPEVIQGFLAGNTTNKGIDTLISRAKGAGINNVRFVPTIARGFDYYTDIVFEVFDLNPENNRAMFGGGRYDGLVGMFGVEPVPTIGIAPGDVTMQNFLESHGLTPNLPTKNDMYLMVENDQFNLAQTYAQKLRADGQNIAVDLSGRKIDKQFKAAKKLGFKDEQITLFEQS